MTTRLYAKLLLDIWPPQTVPLPSIYLRSLFQGYRNAAHNIRRSLGLLKLDGGDLEFAVVVSTPYYMLLEKFQI